MRFRQNAFASVAVVPTLIAAALIVALIAVIGSAQAAPSKKNYDATVRVAAGPATTLQLTLANAPGSNQTLGSANFMAPGGVIGLDVDENSVTDPDFTVAAVGNVIQFRSSAPLSRGQSVSANVQVTTTASCSNATWIAQAKQSNDFSGTGNDFAPGSSTNLRPLGSLAIADVGTEVDDPDTPQEEKLFVPQIKVDLVEGLAVSAKDICGAAYANYGRIFGASATLARKVATPPRLVNATLTQPVWSSALVPPLAGTGTASLEPVDVETGDHLVLSDQFTTIKDESNEFDVVEKICTSFDDTCHWDNGNNKKISVDASILHPGASLGIGFIGDESFSCNNEDEALGSNLIYINPRDYPAGATQSVTLTYDKTIPGTSGNTSNFVLCLSKENGVAGSWFGPIPDCASDPPDPTEPTPCIQDRGRSNGDLFIVLFLDPNVDPVGGLS